MRMSGGLRRAFDPAATTGGATIEVEFMGLWFEWDDGKAHLNRRNHGVGFEEAATVFIDPLGRIFDDEAHSIEEEREILIGHSSENRLLLVCFTERRDAIRIISARKATKRERNEYEENTLG
jgi:uncharacterized DUF497 family protein